MLFVSAGNFAIASAKTNKAAAKAFGVKSGQHLDHIKIKNEFGERIASQCTWRDRNGAHTKQITNITIENGKTKDAAGPMLGYEIKEVTGMESNLVAASAGMSIATAGIAAGGTAAMIKTFMGKANASNYTYFVVTRGQQPKGSKNYKAVVTGYKNKNVYKIYKRRNHFNNATKDLSDAQAEAIPNADKIVKLKATLATATIAYTAEDKAYFVALDALKTARNAKPKNNSTIKINKIALNKTLKVAKAKQRALLSAAKKANKNAPTLTDSDTESDDDDSDDDNDDDDIDPASEDDDDDDDIN